ncbi:hypothetical protein N0V93_007890 [Gnomoniopsis smithogilvyi]|uniref:Glucose-methanol-choline oxidoreductase N-terminal domain-containing protein n=1 Tax=Gnomoniopsis smithogilvyi TaxID=1191159 RepID=A0A9W9CTD6_9PEZI|nr:hypothetical protein N0V93_007890 [Gnomoniopsis smithogilvyi]
MTSSSSFKQQILWAGLASLRFVDGSPIFPRQITTSQLLPKYDYVIIGGGAAGLTVADRLTEDPNVNVLVLEAGGWGSQKDILEVYIPPEEQTGVNLWVDSGWPNLPWVPQEKLGDSRVRSLTVGKVVGGGSAINGMYAMRGTAEDYDRWGQLFGDSAIQSGPADWSWKGMLPYFQKGLKFNAPPPELTDNFPSLKFDDSFWGSTSGVNVGWPSFYWPTVPYFMDAFGQIDGVQFPADSGAGEPGVYWFPSLVDPMLVQRSYAATGHYSNVNETRPNYQLLINTLARRLIFGDNETVTGVEFLPENGNLTTVEAGEVIVSAGAIHTPHILQLSGIGPASLLEAGGIDVVVDLPGVGQNFHDHSGLIDMFIRLTGLSNIHPNGADLGNENTTFYKEAEELWAANRSGPYSIAAPQVAGWLPLTVTMPSQAEALATKLEQQDFASHLQGNPDATVVAGYESQMKLLAASMRSSRTSWTRSQINPNSGVQGPVLMQSFQRGSININTADPWNTEPLIDYNALSNPVELDVMVELVKFTRQLNFNTSLAELGPVEFRPGSNITTDEEIKEYIAQKMNPSDLHPVGSCAMLPLELGGCVDQTLRVYGVKNLRVVDGSVISMIPSANTCQPIYALAEKAAEIIKSGI